MSLFLKRNLILLLATVCVGVVGINLNSIWSGLVVIVALETYAVGTCIMLFRHDVLRKQVQGYIWRRVYFGLMLFSSIFGVVFAIFWVRYMMQQ